MDADDNNDVTGDAECCDENNNGNGADVSYCNR